MRNEKTEKLKNGRTKEQKMFLRSLVLWFFGSLAFWFFSFSFAETLDKVIVVVNGETITQGELDIASGAGAKAAARKEVLDKLIEEKLILSEAQRQKIEVSESELEAKLKEVRGKFESTQGFDEAMEEGGLSLAELKARYADQIKVSKLMELEVRKKLLVTPSELTEYYEVNKERFKEPEQVRVKNILIKPEKDLSDQDARLLAEKVLGFLKAGEGFDELALRYSKGPNADMGGDLGFVKRGQMLKEIDEVVFTVGVGKVSEVIKTQLGYHIFKVEERRPEKTIELNEARDQVEKILFSEKLKKRYKEWIEELKKNAYISFR